MPMTAASWTTANASLYNAPWTSDTQNRCFSLQPLSGGADTSFTIRFLGYPVSVGFKAKCTVNGKTEPAVCLMFPSESSDADAMYCRLFQPCNFVLLNAFEGYKPFSATEISQAKAVKNMGSGNWYKKLWSVYSKVEQDKSYTHDKSGLTVSAAPRRRRVSPASSDNDEKYKALSEEEPVVHVDDEKDKEDNVVDVGGPKKQPPAPTRPNVGEKAPRYTLNLTTWEGCEQHTRTRLEFDRATSIRDRKNAKKILDRKKQARKDDPDIDSDEIDCSDASEEEFEYNEVFDQMVFDATEELWNAQQKKLNRSPSVGSNHSAGSSGKGTHKKVFLNYG